MPFPHRAVLVVGDQSANGNGISRHVARRLTALKSKAVATSSASLKTALPDTLRGCHDLIRELERENVRLREAGVFFGQLAERLNLELRQHRVAVTGVSPEARYSPAASRSQLSRQGGGPNDH
jgi:hypothetical protein